MRPYDRDYYMSTVSVLMEHARLMKSLTEDMSMRLDELQEVIAMKADQEEDSTFESVWQDAYDYRIWEEDQIVYDSARNKQCMCDDCWGVKTDEYHHRMD